MDGETGVLKPSFTLRCAIPKSRVKVIIGNLLGYDLGTSFERYLFEIDPNGETGGSRQSALWIHDKKNDTWEWSQVMYIGSFTTRIRFCSDGLENMDVKPIGFPRYSRLGFVEIQDSHLS